MFEMLARMVGILISPLKALTSYTLQVFFAHLMTAISYSIKQFNDTPSQIRQYNPISKL